MADLMDFWNILLLLPFLFAIPKTKWHRRPDPLFEYYNTGDDSSIGVYGSYYWQAQTFTVGSTGHTISSIKVKLWRKGWPQTGTISIRATNASGHPTGSDLTSASVNGNILTTDQAGSWYEYQVSEITLNPNTKYAIVLRFPSGNDSNMGCWRADITSPTYTYGNWEQSHDGGSTWEGYTTYDLMFEIWGNPPAGVAQYGKYFPNGMRGQLQTVDAYIRNTAGSAQNLVLGFSPSPMAGELFEITNSIPAGFSGWWTVTVSKFWDYESLFIYTKSTTGSNIGLGMDTETTLGDCFTLISNAWQWLPYRPWMRVNVKAQAHYPIPIEKQVSIKEEGIGFIVRGVATNVASGGNAYVLYLKNPSGSGKTVYIEDLIFTINAGVPLGVIVYYDPTVSANGTSVSIENRNIGDSTDSVCSAFRLPTVTSSGTCLFAFDAYVNIRYDRRIILPPNHQLLVQMVNVGPSPQNLTCLCSFSEG